MKPAFAMAAIFLVSMRSFALGRPQCPARPENSVLRVAEAMQRSEATAEAKIPAYLNEPLDDYGDGEYGSFDGKTDQDKPCRVTLRKRPGERFADGTPVIDLDVIRLPEGNGGTGDSFIGEKFVLDSASGEMRSHMRTGDGKETDMSIIQRDPKTHDPRKFSLRTSPTRSLKKWRHEPKRTKSLGNCEVKVAGYLH